MVSRDEFDPDTLMPVWDAKGHITVKRSNTVVAMPTGPEQLRMRRTVMANALIMMKLKHTARSEPKVVTPSLFEKYKDYLLGDYVYGFRASDDSGGMMPPWTLVLSYEHATRKHCYKLMSQQGMSFKLVLEKAWKEPTVKERHSLHPWPKRGYSTTSSATPPTATEKGRARARSVRVIPALQTTSRYVSPTVPKRAARRRLSAILHMSARDALGITLLSAALRRSRRIPRERLTDSYPRRRSCYRRVSLQSRYKASYFGAIPVCRTSETVGHDTMLATIGYTLPAKDSLCGYTAKAEH